MATVEVPVDRREKVDRFVALDALRGVVCKLFVYEPTFDLLRSLGIDDDNITVGWAGESDDDLARELWPSGELDKSPEFCETEIRARLLEARLLDHLAWASDELMNISEDLLGKRLQAALSRQRKADLRQLRGGESDDA